MTQAERLTLMWIVGVLIFFAMAFHQFRSVEQARLDAGIYPGKQKVGSEQDAIYHWRPLDGMSQSD